jgi:hypothetical protein
MTVVEVINQILQDSGYNIAQLSEVTGIGIGPLYKMARGETGKISYISAKKISVAIPKYSVEFLRATDKKDYNPKIKETKSIDLLFAEAVTEKIRPLLSGAEENQKKNLEQTDRMLEMIQHLVLDNDELRDRLALMEKQMNSITKLHT